MSIKAYYSAICLIKKHQLSSFKTILVSYPKFSLLTNIISCQIFQLLPMIILCFHSKAPMIYVQRVVFKLEPPEKYFIDFFNETDMK